jgi:hypothetical protein
LLKQVCFVEFFLDLHALNIIGDTDKDNDDFCVDFMDEEDNWREKFSFSRRENVNNKTIRNIKMLKYDYILIYWLVVVKRTNIFQELIHADMKNMSVKAVRNKNVFVM